MGVLTYDEEKQKAIAAKEVSNRPAVVVEPPLGGGTVAAAAQQLPPPGVLNVQPTVVGEKQTLGAPLADDVAAKAAAPTTPAPTTPPADPAAMTKDTAAAYDPAQVTLDPASDTVEGRVAAIIAKNSPVIQATRLKSLESSNARGLLSSSIASEAADSAVLGAATDIAKADAQHSLDVKGSNQQATNAARSQTTGILGQSQLQQERGVIEQRLQTAEGAEKEKLLARQGEIDKELSRQNSDQQRTLQLEKADIDKQLLTAEGEQKTALLNRQAEIDTEQQTLKWQQQLFAQRELDARSADLQTKLQQMHGDQALELTKVEGANKEVLQNSENAQQMYSTFHVSVTEILNNENIPVDQKQQLINKQIELLNNGLDVIGQARKITVGGTIGGTPTNPNGGGGNGAGGTTTTITTPNYPPGNPP